MMMGLRDDGTFQGFCFVFKMEEKNHSGFGESMRAEDSHHLLFSQTCISMVKLIIYTFYILENLGINSSISVLSFILNDLFLI